MGRQKKKELKGGEPANIQDEGVRNVKTRSIDICASCGDEKEIAAFGMCYTCYRRAARAAEEQKEEWNPGLKTQRRMQRAYSALERALVVECGLSHETADRLIRMVAIQVRPLADYLGEKPPEVDGDVNTGECSRSQEPGGVETPKAQVVGVNARRRNRRVD
jgi:ribosomal protein S14